MSKVYSFRLDEENPREAQAREVIEAWVREGYSIRHQLVEAILVYQHGASNYVDYEAVLERVSLLLEEVKVDHGGKDHRAPEFLSPAFLSAVTKSARAGTRLG